jgi:hypothetical protein
MKKIIIICNILFVLVVALSCTKKDGIDQDLSFLNSINSSKLDTNIMISNDNSGNVKITPLGEGVTSFTVNFGHGTGTAASAIVLPGNSVSYSYPEGSYTLSIIATDIAGKTTTTNYPLTITYRAPEKVTIKIESDMVVSATALYAKSFIVYYGDVPDEVGTPLALEEKLPAHIYPDGGPYIFKLVALSGGAATTTVYKPLFGLPITFDDPATNYEFGTFGAGQGFEKVVNPDRSGLNTSDTVGKFIRGYEAWSGTFSPLNIPINFAYGKKKIKLWAYNPDPALIGKKLNVELEWAVGTSVANPWVAIVKTAVTTSGAWEELEFDFSTNTAIPADARFTQLVFRYNVTALGAGPIIYIDNIRLTN